MRHLYAWITAMVLVVGWETACNRDKKAEQLAALNRGYEAGLLTRSEYEAKKAAILGTPPATIAEAPPLAVQPAVPAAAAPSLPEPPRTAVAPSSRPSASPAPKTPGRSGAVLVPALPPAPPPQEPVVPEPAPPIPQPQPTALPPDNSPRRTPGEEAEEVPAPLPGCQETSARPGKEKGKQERFFPAPVATVKEAAIGALEALEFKVNKDSSREIEASKKRHLGVLVGSGGEKMVLRFEDAVEGGQRGTRVIGETKKNIILRAGQKSWTNVILMQTGCMLRKNVSGRASR